MRAKPLVAKLASSTWHTRTGGDALRRWFVIGCLGALAGCTSKVARQEIIGTYAANASSSNDTLEVRSDGTYVHSYASGDRQIRQRGGWLLEPEKDGETRVTFAAFVMALGPLQSAGPGFWSATVKKHLGNVRLMINDDMGLYYVKK